MNSISVLKDRSSGPSDDAAVWTLTFSEFREAVAKVVREAVAEVHTDASDGLLTLEQAAQFLGCSVRHLHRLREAGLPTVFLIGSPRFERAAILEFLRNQKGRQQ